MAQKQFINYKDKVESLPLMEMGTGINRPGRYSGFDLASISGDTLTLLHSNKIVKVNISGETIPFGSFKTPLGMIIHEDGPIVVTIPPNNNQGGSGVVEIHQTYHGIVVAEHNYNQVEGGIIANYFIVMDYNSGAEPQLPDPTKQSIIGRIKYITVNNEYRYTPEPAPLPGDSTILEHLKTMPYATNNSPGLVIKSGIDSESGFTNPDLSKVKNDIHYITPKQVSVIAGINYIVGIGTLQTSSNQDGEWKEIEITNKIPIADREYVIKNIENWDVRVVEIFGNREWNRSLKAGYFQISHTPIIGAPTPTIMYPNLIIDRDNLQLWLEFWTNHSTDIQGVKLMLQLRGQ